MLKGMTKIYINGKTHKFYQKELAQWEIILAAGIDPQPIAPDRRILYVAKDGLPEMLGRYENLQIHEGMHVSLIFIDYSGYVRIPNWKIKNQ